MKILAINASHRGDQGYTRFLIDRLVQGASAAGAECEVVTLARIKMQRCLGCGLCHTDAHLLRCVYDDKDDVRAVFAKMAAADVIVYATPVYIFNMSGLLKTFLDRINATGNSRELRLTESGLMFHHIDAAICSKPLVTLVCCDNNEDETTKNVRAYFRTYARFMDAPLVGELVRTSGRMAGHGRDPSAEQRFPRLSQVYAAFEQAGAELAAQGRIRAATQRRANQAILPVPFFALLKRIPFKAFKQRFIARAQALQDNHLIS